MITGRTVVLVILVAVPLLFAFAFPRLSLDFSPRSVIYSNEILPVLFAPVAWPETTLSALSRLLQCVIIYHLEDPVKALGVSWAGWTILALIRTLCGFVLSRSVGWAYPALFSHWALYEKSTGIGAALLAYWVICDPSFVPSVVQWSDNRWAVPVVTFACCWLEASPWTYGTAFAAAYPLAWLVQLQQATLPGPITTEKPSPIRTRLLLTLRPFAATLLVITICQLVPPTRLPLPATDQPLVDILMLSYPRPVPTDVSAAIINASISSYLPYLSPAVSLSLFTHAITHDALAQVYSALDDPRITLHVDSDSHPSDLDGHYLHLAEAFRWILEDAFHTGEWVMLVEDDFTVCEGIKSWEVITTVVNKLEIDRQKGVIRSGFIGTGGSGIIIHRSYLPTLIFLLRTLSTAESPLHPNFVRRAPDQIIHDCILGRPYSFCERRDADQSKLIITSRLVLDHIGGMATTTAGKLGNVDKWRCGWRHAFHGDDMVEVVVV